LQFFNTGCWKTTFAFFLDGIEAEQPIEQGLILAVTHAIIMGSWALAKFSSN